MLSRWQGHFRLEVSVSLARGLPTAGALAFQVQSPPAWESEAETTEKPGVPDRLQLSTSRSMVSERDTR